MTALPFRRRLGFALGDTGFNFVWQSIELYLLFFYTQVLHLPMGWAAAIFFIGAVVDWVSDPVIGALADRTAARTGRMRVWLIAAAPAIGCCLVLAFAKPNLTLQLLFWWALGTHVLLRIAYSAGNIPYAALTARITRDDREQARLTGLRMQCAALGGLTVAAVYWSAPEIAGSSSDASRFLMGAVLLALLVQPFLLISWSAAVELPSPRRTPLAFSYRSEVTSLVRLVRGSRALVQLLLIILFAGLTTSLTGKSILFLFSMDFGSPDLGYPATLLPALALLLSTPVWLLFRDRYGALATLKLAAMVHLAGVGGLAGANVAGAPHAWSFACLALAITATTGLSVIFWAMVASVAAASGDCHARVYALATTARKLAQALASPSLALGLWVSSAATPDARVSPVLAVVALICTLGILMLTWRNAKPLRAIDQWPRPASTKAPVSPASSPRAGGARKSGFDSSG